MIYPISEAELDAAQEALNTALTSGATSLTSCVHAVLGAIEKTRGQPRRKTISEKEIDLLSRNIILGAELAGERDRNARLLETANRYWDIRDWLRLCDNDDAGHAEFFKEASLIIFGESDDDEEEPDESDPDEK